MHLNIIFIDILSSCSDSAKIQTLKIESVQLRMRDHCPDYEDE